jgi:hypothetical protein
MTTLTRTEQIARCHRPIADVCISRAAFVDAGEASSAPSRSPAWSPPGRAWDLFSP